MNSHTPARRYRRATPRPLLLALILPGIAWLLPAPLSAQSAIVDSDDSFVYRAAIDSADGNCTARSITITNRSDGAVVQTITPGENTHDCEMPPEQVFAVMDANFDGHGDIMLMQFLPASPNVPYYFWIYDPSTGLFAEDSTLETITSPEFDAKRNVITSFWRSSCCDHGLSTYRYIGGRLTLVEEREEAESPVGSGYMVTTVRKLVGGKMKLVSRKRAKMSREE